MKRTVFFVATLATSFGLTAGIFAIGCSTEDDVLRHTADANDASAVEGRDAGEGTHTRGDPGSNDGGQREASSDGCTIAKVENPDYGGSVGPSGCVAPSNCTVRFTGNYCCPDQPQAMTQGAAMLFDESMNGFGMACRERCQTVRCGLKLEAGATCVAGSCTLTSGS